MKFKFSSLRKFGNCAYLDQELWKNDAYRREAGRRGVVPNIAASRNGKWVASTTSNAVVTIGHSESPKKAAQFQGHNRCRRWILSHRMEKRRYWVR